MRIASIDIGTNTLRLLIGELSETGGLEKIHIERVITRLGEDFSENKGVLKEEARLRTLEALNGFSGVLKSYGVERTRAVATSVVRESKDPEEFKNLVLKVAGIDVEVISGEEEAKLTVSGVLGSVEVSTNEALIFDIGGGSTEYILVREGSVIALKSTSLGAVHMTEQYLSNNINYDSQHALLQQHIDNILDSDLKDFRTRDTQDLSLIGTAGTPTTLAAIELGLRRYNPSKVNGFVLKRVAIEDILRKLLRLTPEQRLLVPGLEKGREDLIIAGAITTIQTMKKFSQQSLVVSDGGLLEGVLYSIAD